MKYAFIDTHRGEYPVSRLCSALNVAESGYYAWKKRTPSQRQQEDERLGMQIKQIYQSNRHVYGSPRIHAELKAQGTHCGRKRVVRLMQKQGISARMRKRRMHTTDSQHTNPIAPNLLSVISAPMHRIKRG